ncbi:MAG: FecR domain-containing protein, partial [bacterium]
MKTLKLSTLLLLGLLLALPAWGATKYGDAVIKNGKLTVLREGRRMVFSPTDRQVQINHQDVIRLGSKSSAVLQTVEKATLTLGSNAVLQVEPWKRRQKTGLMKMLFGRFRATITGLTGAQRFNVKTATATIGVKGTDLTVLTTPNERVLVWVKSSNSQAPVTLEGLFGDEQNLNVGFASVVVGTTPAAEPVEATPALQQELASVDSPPANSPEAEVLPPAAQEAGLPTDSDDGTDDAAEEGEEPEESNTEEQAADVVEQVEAATQSATEDLFRADVRIIFE